MAHVYGIVQHYWAVVPHGFNHVGPLMHDITSNGLATCLGFIGF